MFTTVQQKPYKSNQTCVLCIAEMEGKVFNVNNFIYNEKRLNQLFFFFFFNQLSTLFHEFNNNCYGSGIAGLDADIKCFLQRTIYNLSLCCCFGSSAKGSVVRCKRSDLSHILWNYKHRSLYFHEIAFLFLVYFLFFVLFCLWFGPNFACVMVT